MKTKALFVLAAGLMLGGCATGGRHFGYEASNSRSQCANRMALKNIPPAQLHNYMQRCTDGGKSDSSSDKPFKIQISGGSR